MNPAAPLQAHARHATCAVAATALLTACAGPSSPPSGDADACTKLKGQSLGQQQATITDAKLVPEAANVPAHCAVNIALNDSTLRVEARLPITGWNGKMVALGGGGFKGAVFPPTLPFFSPSINAERYATIATNGGYDYPTRDGGYFKAEFAYDPIKFADYTNLSIHRALPLGKELVGRFYGTPAKKNYFEGCSAGGHEAMMLSQRFPGDFDGIVARAPAGNFMGLFLQFNNVAKASRAPGGTLNTAKQTVARQGRAAAMRRDGRPGRRHRLQARGVQL